MGDCWIGLTQAKDSGLILAARVGKRIDRLLDELVTSTEGQTNCQQWDTDGWSGYQRVFPPEVQHRIGKVRTQRLERTNGILRYSDRTMASPAEQVWSTVGADEGNDTIGGELLRLDMGAYPSW